MSAPSVDTELVALVAGLKPAMRITAPPDRADEVAARYRARGLCVVPAAEIVPIGGRAVAILYVARGERDADLLREAEARTLPGGAVANGGAQVDAHREIGRRLGFPRCCVEAFCARVARGVDRLPDGPTGLAEDYVAAREAGVARPDARINNLLFAARTKVVSFYPCRYDCEVAIHFAQAVLDAIARRAPDAARALVVALSRPIVIAPSNARAMVTIGVNGGIARAEAPRDPSGRIVSAADEALAASLAGAAVKADGEVVGTGAPAAWLVPFGRS